MTPIRSAPPIVWAVFLGCFTAHRLAVEWGISKEDAAALLISASRCGWLRRFRRGQYRVEPDWLRGDARAWRRQRQLDYYRQRGADRRRHINQQRRQLAQKATP